MISLKVEPSLILSEFIGELFYADLNICSTGHLRTKCNHLDISIQAIVIVETYKDIKNIAKKIEYLREAGFFDEITLKSMIKNNKIVLR